MDNLSLSDIASVTGNKDGFLEGNGIIILILFFLIFGFGGGAWGNNLGRYYTNPPYYPQYRTYYPTGATVA